MGNMDKGVTWKGKKLPAKALIVFKGPAAELASTKKTTKKKNQENES